MNKDLKDIKESMIKLNIEMIKDRDKYDILLKKINKISNDVEDIKKYVKWRKIFLIIYWIFIFGSVFGIWYFMKNFLDSSFEFLEGVDYENFSMKDVLEIVKGK